jgi:hypothetical protein
MIEEIIKPALKEDIKIKSLDIKTLNGGVPVMANTDKIKAMEV